jgi:hypothetical protein
MIIRRVFDELAVGKGISDGKYEGIVQTVTKKINPVFKKLNREQFSDYWIQSMNGFEETFYAIKDYLSGDISLDEFRETTYEYWSDLSQNYEKFTISNEHNQHNIWVIGYFAILLKKLFYNYSESEMERDLTKIKQDLLPTLKDIPESLESAKFEVDNIVKRTIKVAKKYFDSN